MSAMKKVLTVLLVVGLMAGLALGSAASAEELTPTEYDQMTAAEKIKAKTIVVKVPETWLHSDAPLPAEWESNKVTINGMELLHTSNLDQAVLLYSRNLFELAHPNVRIEAVEMPLYQYPATPQTLVTRLAAGTAPSLWPMWATDDFAAKGYLADVTDLYKAWPLSKQLDAAGFTPDDRLWVKGRLYGCQRNTGGVQTGVLFRKDWFREAGIFDEAGEPGPNPSWTHWDLRDLAKKLTDPKKNRWGLSVFPGAHIGFRKPMTWGWFLGASNAREGHQWLVPDPSGDFTWKFVSDIPEIVEMYQFENDMVFKDKSTLTTKEWGENEQEFWGGRAAMIVHNAPSIPGWIYGTPHRLSADVKLEDQIAWVPMSAGKYGIQVAYRSVGGMQFSPTLSAEELKAAFDWNAWDQFGKGFELKMRNLAERYALGLPLDIGPIMSSLIPVPEGIRLPKKEELMTPQHRSVLKYCEKLPTIVFPGRVFGGFGLTWPFNEDQKTLMEALESSCLFDPNFNIAEELKKLAKGWNALRTKEEFKIENDQAKLKELVLWLDDWWKGNFPKYHGSDEYQAMYEKYFAWVAK